MKNKYKIIAILLVLEYICLSIMDKLDLHIKSWIGNAIGTLVFLTPLLILLNLLEKDEDISAKVRFSSKIVFWFLIICYIAGGIGKALALL